jgi:hypothetical protein
MRQDTAEERDQHLKSLDEWIERLGGVDEGLQTESDCSLLVEHLEAARRNLLAAMPAEYALSLEQGLQSVSRVSDEKARAEITRTLRNLINAQAPAFHSGRSR